MQFQECAFKKLTGTLLHVHENNKLYSVSQYMHLNAPRTTCLCVDTCYSKQTTIPPEHFAAVPIASAGTVSAWHRGEAYKQS